MDERGQVRSVTRWQDTRAERCEDLVALEEPLELQIGGISLAVIMRTPGHDEELALGFLLTERVIVSADQVVRIRHCNVVPDPDAEDNVIQVTLREGVTVDYERLRRNLYASSSCGVCGKATLANVLATAPPLDLQLTVSAQVLYRLPERLREAQAMFDVTGGLHGAGLFDRDGGLLAVREDVGRHNAVDKVIGWAVRQGMGLIEPRLLMISGRASFEIVQKAAAARIPVVAAVSAPSSLAVALAESVGITLIGFLRGQGMNVYSRPDRVVTEAP